MQLKPDFLGPHAASAFGDSSVAESYRFRPPYPESTFGILENLAAGRPRTILDVGCGSGYLARRMVHWADRVDALDISRPMLEQGKISSGGDDPRLRWINESAEEAVLDPPYTLITAGDSLHWMDWDVVMPRFGSMLTKQGFLAVLGVEQLATPWEDALWTIRRRYSVIPNFQYFDLITGLEDRNLFQRFGVRRTEPETFIQSLDDYIESFHGRAAFSRERMSSEQVTAFHDEIRSLVTPFCPDRVELQIVAEIVWGKPRGARARSPES